MLRRLIHLGIAIAALLGAPAAAEERILAFDASLAIAADGGLAVEETISVIAEGIEIRRGIYRDFPTRYRDSLGNRVVLHFALKSVTRDGAPEPHHLERLENGVRIYVGDAQRLVAPGRHVYRLAYEVDGAIGFFEGHDELYWNVTGHGWAFPIERATASLSLPDEATPEEVSAYTGPQGARGTDYRVIMRGPGRARIEATRPLGPREGLTMVVTFAKGVVAEPTFTDRAMRFLRDNAGSGAALATFFGALSYLTFAWLKVGRDPRPGTVIPRFTPPESISPAAARFVRRMGFDGRAFAAALVSLAVKGYLTIEEEGKTFRLVKASGDPAGLSKGERALAEALLRWQSTIVLKPESHAVVGRARDALRRTLDAEYEGRLFMRNTRAMLPGLLILVAGAVAAILLSGDDVTVLTIIALLTTGALLPLFYVLMRAPTRLGRTVMDEIDGFKMFLETAEKERLRVLHPPEMTPALFEAYLPYAIALGVEHAWSARFAREALEAGTAPGEGYAPRWYRGQRFLARSGSLGSGFASALAASAAAAATPPGARSGAGGRGFSGGGGGGGGGGGW